MKYTTYSRYIPELADTVNLQALLDQLADFLLQSGFAGGAYSHPFWGEFGEDEADRSLDARSEEHTSELQSLAYLVCRLLLEKKKKRVTADVSLPGAFST